MNGVPELLGAIIKRFNFCTIEIPEAEEKKTWTEKKVETIMADEAE